MYFTRRQEPISVAFWAYSGSHKTGVRLGLHRILGAGSETRVAEIFLITY